jgi:hypothetical protein
MREVDEPHARIPLKTDMGGLGPLAISFYQALGARQESGSAKGIWHR